VPAFCSILVCKSVATSRASVQVGNMAAGTRFPGERSVHDRNL
jgi:hypothetical protein